MEETKYFTPDIEDIRVGYECEILWNYNYLPENEWCQVRALQGSTEEFDLYDFTSRISKNEIRVPYLTKEQIEAEGWKQLDDISPFTGRKYKWRKSHEEGFNNWCIYTLEFETKGKIQIHLATETSYINENKYIYSGKCPSINELRYISKLLGI